MVLCFNCHNYQVYYNASELQARASTTLPAMPANRDNTTNAFGIWCMNCHGAGRPEEFTVQPRHGP